MIVFQADEHTVRVCGFIIYSVYKTDAILVSVAMQSSLG